MAKALIRLKNQGINSAGNDFDAIYGSYTKNADNSYTISTYTIPPENIASVFIGEISTTFKRKGFLEFD